MGRKINLTINDVKSLKSSKNCHSVWYYNIRKSDFQNSIVLARWKYNIENVFQCWLCNKFFLNYYSMKKNRKKVTSGNFETKTKHIFIFL